METTIQCEGKVFKVEPPQEDDWPWILEGLEVSYIMDVPSTMATDQDTIRRKALEDMVRLREGLLINNELMVARDDQGQRAAYLWVMAIPLQYTGEMRGWMFQLYVSEGFRSLGLGKALMGLGEEWTRSLGLKSIAVMVGAKNKGGVGILRSMGFEIEGYNMGKSLSPMASDEG